MVFPLIDAGHLGDLRKNNVEHAGIEQQAEADGRKRRPEDLQKLIGHAFLRNHGKPLAHLLHRSERFRRDGKPKLGGKTDRPQDSERIVFERLFRIERRTQQSRCDVGPPAKRVKERPVGVTVDGSSDSVYREIPAAEIVIHRSGSHIGVARIGSISFTPRPDKLHLPPREGNGCSPESFKRNHRRRADVFRKFPRKCNPVPHHDDIDILIFAPQNRIADISADNVDPASRPVCKGADPPQERTGKGNMLHRTGHQILKCC